jgi:hypothetical protein
VETILPSPRSIPTLYRGTHFRSRLEARWAATFDSLGWYWEYESTALDFGDGFRYLCDFHLPAQACWVEVKGPFNDRIDKTNHLRKVTPRRDLVIIARPAGPDGAANFHSVTGFTGVSIQKCGRCTSWCFHDYDAARTAGDPGWTCRTCHHPEGLQGVDGYLPAITRENILSDVVRGQRFLDAFWPTTGGLLLLAEPSKSRRP